MTDSKQSDFHPVLVFEQPPVELDLTEQGYDPERVSAVTWAIGRWDEPRPQQMYSAPQYDDGRNVHMGVDLFAPAGTPVYAFTDGRIHALADNDRPGDYGPTIVTEQVVHGERLWALYGHLSRASLEGLDPGRPVRRGERLGWLGSEAENGGWPPHLHLQLCRERPERADLPGVVTPAERERARHLYPDPRPLLGLEGA